MRKLKLLLVTLALIVGGALSANAREDVTSTYLVDAGLSDQSTNWALVSNGGNHTAPANGYCESWHNTFTITQTTGALPAGYYQLSIQAAVEGGTSTTISLQATSGSNSSVAAYPKYSTADSYANMAAWWAADATHTGNRDLNRIFTTVYVEEGQTLTATFKQTANNQWFVYGQMQLHKLTDEEGRYAQILETVHNPMTNLDMATGRYKQRFENYTGGTVPGLGKKLVKTISGLPNGKYSVTLNGGASFTSGNGVTGGSTGDNLTVFFANDANTNVSVVDRTGILNDAFTDYTASGALVTNGNLEVGFNNIDATGANWFVGSVKYIELTEPYISYIATAIPAATATALTANKWYKFTPVSNGDHSFDATTNIGDVIYTTTDQLPSTATGTTASGKIDLTAGTTYYIKSSSAQTLTISPQNYTYTVGAATPSVADGKYTQANTFTLTFSANTDDPDGEFQLLDATKITVNGSAATASVTGKVLTITLADALTASTDYAISVAAGAVGYNAENVNAAISLTVHTPAVFDGKYYIANTVGDLFISRGGNGSTESILDKYGLPVEITTDADNVSHVKFLEGDYYLYAGSKSIYSDKALSAGGDNVKWTIASYSGGYSFHTNRDRSSEANIGNYMAAGSGYESPNYSTVATYAEAAYAWKLKTKAERDAIVAAYPAANMTSVITAASLTSETNAAGFEAYLAANYAAEDKTASVNTAKFTGNAGSWTWASGSDSSGDPAYGIDWTEAFEKSGTWSQTITGLSQGIYKVTVNGFERKVGYAVCNTLGADGYQPVTAYFKANNEQTALKSWYSDKEETSNPNNTGEAATAFNNDKYKNSIYTYVGTDGNLTLTIGKQDKVGGSWVLFNNVTLTYYNNTLTDGEKTAILAEATTEMAKPMKPSLYQALSSAKTTFEGTQNMANYNALRTAIDNTATSVASYAAMKTNYLDKIAAVLATTNVYSTTSAAYTEYAGYKDAYDNYKNPATADIENATANSLTYQKAGSGGDARYTASTGTSLLVADWKINGNDATANNSGFYINSWSTENAGTAPAKDFENPFYEMWVSGESLGAATLTRTITGLTANGMYKVTANIRVQGNDKVAGSITLKAGEGTAIDVTAGNKIGSTSRYIGAYTAFGEADADGKLTITMTVAADSKVSWLAFRDVNCLAVDASDIAQASDYTALSTAISTAEGKTLGFENGDYAPYNNIAALEALAAAKAIDQTAINLKATVTSATTALTSATWTVNTEEMNAIDNGNFATAEDRGWAFSAWGEFVSGLNTNTNASNGTARSSNSGTLTYGEKVGYTMPLKANTKYTLTFKVASWDNNNKNTGTKVSVLNGSDEGLAETTFDARNVNRDQSGAFVTYKADFKTGAAGDYTLVITAQGARSVYTDIVLKRKTASANMTITSAKYATFIAPFDVAIPEGVTASKVLTAEDKTLNLTPVETTIPANTPVVLYKDVTGDDFTQDFNGVDTSLEETYTVGLLTGVYEDTPATAGTYVLQNQSGAVAFYKVTSGNEPTVGKNRAYVNAGAFGAGIKAFFFDEDETTAIEGLDVLTSGEYDAIYNAAGIQVEALQKGLNIVVKDGKSYKIYVK